MVNLLWKTTRLTLAILSLWAVFLQALYLIQLGRFELAGFLSFFRRGSALSCNHRDRLRRSPV